MKGRLHEVVSINLEKHKGREKTSECHTEAHPDTTATSVSTYAGIKQAILILAKQESTQHK